MWHHVLRMLPNGISASRLAAVPFLWMFCLSGDLRAFGIGLLACLASDVLDGWLARRLGVVSSFGAKLDSAADNAMLVSAPFWAPLVAPEILQQHAISFGLFVMLLITTFFCMALKFRRNVEIHTYAAKLGVGIMWIYIALASLYQHIVALYLLFIVTSVLYLLEDIYLLLTRDYLDEHVISALPIGQWSRERPPH